MTRVLGLALVDFVWQGAAIGAGTALVLALMRRRSPHARYLIAVVSLAIMAAAPMIDIGTADPAPIESHTPARALDSPPIRSGAAPALPAATPAPLSREWLEPRLPFIVSIWCGGVLLLFVQLVRGWFVVARLRRLARPVDGQWPRIVRELSSWLGVRRHLDILESALVDVPAVIGVLRPAILVPASALAGLAPAHLEAILAHELAHIRRGDYLINVLQCVVETLLFYHPAVWWVSTQVRVEREHCCDDEAAAVCGDRVTYAHALVSLEELRSVPRLAVAASGGVLLNRIRRLIEPAALPRQRFSGGLIMSVVLMMVMFSVAGEVQSIKVAPAVVPIETMAPAAPAEPTVPAAPRAQPPVAATVAKANAAARQIKSAPPPSLSGTITDKNGGSLPGATVIVSGPNGESKILTSGNGTFAVRDLPAGTYTLSFSMTGFQLTRRQVTIPAGGTVSMALAMQLAVVTDEVTITSQGSGTPATPTEGPTPSDYFDLAKRYYEQGRLSDAERMTTHALELMRAGIPTVTSPVPVAIGTGPIAVGGSIKEPRNIYKTTPVYPEFALAVHVQGTVFIEAVIAKDGSVKDATIISGPALLRDAALDAVRRWRYTPTLLGGVPVEVTISVALTFREQ